MAVGTASGRKEEIEENVIISEAGMSARKATKSNGKGHIY